jgi:hypothetical protein
MITKKANKYGSLDGVVAPPSKTQAKVLKTAEAGAALAKTAKLASIEAIETASFRLWEAFASNLSRLAPEQYPQAIQFVKTIGKLAEDSEKALKQMVVPLLKEKGAVATDAGTRRMTVSGYELEIQPTGNGYDSKKVEALLRAKAIDVTLGMDQEISYKLNETKLATLVGLGRMSKEELETCKKEEGWKMMSPKKKES